MKFLFLISFVVRQLVAIMSSFVLNFYWISRPLGAGAFTLGPQDTTNPYHSHHYQQQHQQQLHQQHIKTESYHSDLAERPELSGYHVSCFYFWQQIFQILETFSMVVILSS